MFKGMKSDIDKLNSKILKHQEHFKKSKQFLNQLDSRIVK